MRQQLVAPVAQVIECRLIPRPDSWADADRAHMARQLAQEMVEHLSTYGAGVTLNALSIALDTVADVARTCSRTTLASAYSDAAQDAHALAVDLDRAERT